MATLFQILSILGFSIGNSLWHKPVQTLPVTLVISIKSLLTTIIFLLFLIIAYQFPVLQDYGVVIKIKNFHLIDVLYTVCLCGISYWGLYFFSQSLKHTASGITITIVSAGTIIGFLVAIFVYNEKLSFINVTSSILGTFGLWCLEKLSPAFFKLQFTKGMLFGLLSMLFWRIGSLFPLVINKVGVLPFCFILELTVFGISLLMFLCSEKRINFDYKFLKPHLLTIVLIAISNFFGIFGSNLALKFTSMENYTILGFLTPIVTFTISLICYREQYSIIQYFGIFIIIFGGVSLNWLIQYI